MTSVNPDLVVEREGATFDVLSLTNILDRGAEKTARRRYIQNLVASDRDFDGPEYAYLSREERYSEGIRKSMLEWSKRKNYNLTDAEDIGNFVGMIHPNETWPTAMHPVAFEPPMLSQGSEEQIAVWGPKMKSGEMIGCYAQTELSHGTNLRKLGTTATYDAKTKEFVLNTPEIGATKWWVGTLGKTANHALVMAQLITKGKNEGMHAFLVQLRELETHQPLPGITVGDIGPKFGFDEMDNGFLKMDNIRIPRGNMLMKYAKVHEDGTYVKPVNAKVTYGGMLGIRAGIPRNQATNLAKAVTIATRYSCVRHQSELKPGAPEPKILEFQTQQHKLFPLIARAYAFWFSSTYLHNQFNIYKEEMAKNNFRRLPELHALSAGLKAISTFRCSEGIEVCRLACGGHGFSQASGLPKIYTNSTAAVTAEGECTILKLQTARYLLKCAMNLQQGKQLEPSSEYLSKVNLQSARFGGQINLDNLLEAYQVRSALALQSAAGRVQKLVMEGKEQYDAVNLSGVYLVRAAEAHCDVVVVQSFIEAVMRPGMPGAVTSVLSQLCELYSLHGLVSDSGALVLHGYLSSAQLDSLREKQFTLYKELRPNAIALVDAFDFPDRLLSSVLGRYDGNVYENLYKWARDYDMNKTDVHPSHDKYIKPFRDSMKAKL